MPVCGNCRKEIEVSRPVPRRATCPLCGADLHTCLNCRFHSPSSHNQCSEPKAEHQRNRDRANFCDYFEFRSGGQRAADGSATEDARKRFDDLFKK